MARASVPTSSRSAASEATQTIVRVRASWSGSWQVVPYLRPVRAEVQAGPGIGRATLRFNYGRILRNDKTAFRYFTASNLAGYFVQIQSVNPRYTLWSGYIPTDMVSPAGARDSNENGNQELVAYEIGHLLDSVSLTGARIDNGAGGNSTLGWMPVFNQRSSAGPEVTGNRSSSKVPTGGTAITSAYAFGGSDAWTNRDIVEYLLAYHAPSGMSVYLSGQTEILDNLTDVHRLEGMSLWSALGRLIPRRRGVGFTVDVWGDVLVVRVFSMLGSPVSVGDVTHPANPYQIRLNLDSGGGVDQSQIAFSKVTQYDRVVVTGERLMTCCTLSFSDSTLATGWTEAEETAYESLTELSGAIYDANRNDQERRSDKYKRVFQSFVPAPAWDWTVGGYNAAPSVWADGTVDATTNSTTWPAEKRIARFLPFEKAASASDTPEYVEPLVVVQSSTDQWVQVDAADDEDGSSRCQVRTLDREAGLLVEPPINHVLGLNHFPDATTRGPSNYAPIWDYETLRATVMLPTDERLRVTASAASFGTASEPQTLYLSVEGVEAWYVVPGTVTGVSGGALVTHAGGLVRDDRLVLAETASAALAYYSKERSKVSVTLKQTVAAPSMGIYIVGATTGLETRSVGTVVTRASWNFESGTTSMATDYADLDIAGMAEVPGIGSMSDLGREVSSIKRSVRDVVQRTGNLPVRSGGGAGGSGGTSATSWLLVNEGGV